MNTCEQIAKHLRDVHFGENWTAVNLADVLQDVTWQEATTRPGSLHSIASLVYHMNYYLRATIGVMQGGPLEAHDSESFDCPAIASEEDWQALQAQTRSTVNDVAKRVESMPESQLAEPFADGGLGTWFRCLMGPVEHCHYHLGQIIMIKRLVRLGTEFPAAHE